MAHQITKGISFFMSMMLMGILVLSFNACYYDNEEELYPNPCDTSFVTYNNTIVPIIESNCNVCHSQNIQQGGIITEGHNNLLVLVENGKLWGAINHKTGFQPMPQNSNKLSDCKLQQIKNWIDQGAPNN